MISQNIRNNFLKYFEEKGHAVVPSASVLPHEDPTLLFNNAGMNQFKDLFLGKSSRNYTRAVSCQKCIRAGGKHNDLDNVGHTTRHLTFFEMLGNFSFGDYFKQEAIKFAWDVATTVFTLDPDRIYPSVFQDDEEAFEIWLSYVPEKRIVRFGEKENFWAMGETGPCGPCSELLYDRGPDFGSAGGPEEDPEGERFFEFWNLVFMQFNRQEDGKMRPLPKPSIDTGAGLERIALLKMGVNSVFETDVLQAIIGKIELISGKSYSKNKQAYRPAFHVISDHLRCLSFAIADGVQPGNVDCGYVLRKILRRAVRYGKMLGLEKPFLARIFPALDEAMGQDYPELRESSCRIKEVLTTEEEAFFRTLKRGGNLLGRVIEESKEKVSGEDAFKLKDTYGLPIEEILLIAKDSSLIVDLDRFEELEEEARERSKRVHKKTGQVAEESLFDEFVKNRDPIAFVGYEHHCCKAHVIALLQDGAFVEVLQEGQEGMVLLDQTPFYAEMGGQVGDTGMISGEGGRFLVLDTKTPYPSVIAHLGRVENGTLRLGQEMEAGVDSKRREKIACNHTATHLLHWALQEVLGAHVKQAGSVVDNERLRFDFSHHKGLTNKEIRTIENLVNAKVRLNKEVLGYELSYDEVRARDDIKQFFGDKYGSLVRVIDINFSKELCGGTHTGQTGDIGYFRITKEGSIAAGVRRIEAVTGKEAEVFAQKAEERLYQIADIIKTDPVKLEGRLELLLAEREKMKQELKEAKKEKLASNIQRFLADAEKIEGVSLLSKQVDLPPDELKDLADALFEEMDSGILLLGSSFDSKCQLIARVSPDLIGKGFSAVKLIKAVAPYIQGGGGGKADSAQAGGKAPDQLKAALLKARTLIFNQ